MSSSFKFHSAVPEIVPWQAQYKFPSQANKIRKQTVKLVPKNGSTFAQNQIIRFELPADGYCNMLNTALSFDVVTALPLVPIAADSSQPQAIGTPIVSLPRGGAHNYIKRFDFQYFSLSLPEISQAQIIFESRFSLTVKRKLFSLGCYPIKNSIQYFSYQYISRQVAQ